jgi:hypothetical protein
VIIRIKILHNYFNQFIFFNNYLLMSDIEDNISETSDTSHIPEAD